MLTKLTKSGGHSYVHLVESYRYETCRHRQLTVSTLGRLDEAGGQAHALFHGEETIVLADSGYCGIIKRE